MFSPSLESQEGAIALGTGVASGEIPRYTDYFRAINISVLDDHQKVDLIKNLYLAHCYGSCFMEDFRAACSNKMIEIAQSYDGVSGSTNFKIAYLLYLSQINEQENEVAIDATDDVVETVINRLDGAVNQDKENAQRCLRRFYRVLKTSRFACYATHDD
jgi:hypothetical protein